MDEDYCLKKYLRKNVNYQKQVTFHLKDFLNFLIIKKITLLFDV